MRPKHPAITLLLILLRTYLLTIHLPYQQHSREPLQYYYIHCHLHIVPCLVLPTHTEGDPNQVASMCGTPHLSWADSFTKLASDAALLPIWIPPEGMLSSEPGAEGSLLKGVVEFAGSRKKALRVMDIPGGKGGKNTARLDTLRRTGPEETPPWQGILHISSTITQTFTWTACL